MCAVICCVRQREEDEEKEEQEQRRVSNEKQEPHTEMWGKTFVKMRSCFCCFLALLALFLYV